MARHYGAVRSYSSSTSSSFSPLGSNAGVKSSSSKRWLKMLRASSNSQPPTESSSTQQLLLRHDSRLAHQWKEGADHDAVDLLRLVKRAVNPPLDTLVYRLAANREDREPQLAVVVVVVRLR
jgi:hypothetical protein